MYKEAHSASSDDGKCRVKRLSERVSFQDQTCDKHTYRAKDCRCVPSRRTTDKNCDAATIIKAFRFVGTKTKGCSSQRYLALSGPMWIVNPS